MADFPEKELVQKLIPWRLDKRRNNVPPFVSTAEIKRLFSLADEAYGQLFRWFFQMGVWNPLGTDRLVLTPFVDEFSQRFPVTSQQVRKAHIAASRRRGACAPLDEAASAR